ncbi:MAG: stage II sporulation protein M [Candidatus Bathyarchaeia archaeon]
MVNLDFWINASPRRKRIISIIVVFVVLLVITIAGSLTPIDAQEAKRLTDNLNQTINALKESDALMQYIFGNNLLICILMVIPVIGPIIGCYALFNTGGVIGAIAAVEGYPPAFAFAALFVTPVAWLEYMAYSASISESAWLFRRVLQGKFRHELKNACIFITLCTALLLIGAVIETVMLSVKI